MMNIRVKLLVAIILYQFFLFVHAQGLIDVRHYSIEDGLSQNIVQDMLQDDDGYIWLATWNGLEKYDGYTFKNYKSYPCLLYTSPSPRDRSVSRMPSSA